MLELSERDKIIMDLKSELFDIQQHSKNVKKLEESNNEFFQENRKLQDTNNKLEFKLNKIREETSKKINDLESEIININKELNQKKDMNIKLFQRNEALENKLKLIIKENDNLSKNVNYLINKNNDNKILIEQYIKQIKMINGDIQKYQNTMREMKEKYKKNIIFFKKKISELQIAINHLYNDNKTLVKLYKMSYNNKEIDDKVISSLINFNLLPKNIIPNEILAKNYENEENDKICNRNKRRKFEECNEKKKNRTATGIKMPLTNEDNVKYNNTDDELFSPYGYDINKSYNFNKMRINRRKKLKRKLLLEKEEEINKKTENSANSVVLSDTNKDKLDNKFFYELIKVQEENILLKKQVLNLAEQNERIIYEIDNIVKVSGMSTIDVTSEGIKHLEQVIFNNRELLEKYLDEVRKK